MKQGISIKVLDIDKDDTVHYLITLRNDTTSTAIEFYDYQDSLREFGGDLLSFPKNVDDVVSFQVGSRDSQSAYFLFIKAFCFERDGRSVLHVEIDNKMKIPESNKCEFYIPVTPASLNVLGNILKNWNPQLQNEIEWIAQ